MDGIIPAYAGSTAELLHGDHSVRDHPRIRGEHPPEGGMALTIRGSSPHTRGARIEPDDGDPEPGIIPAYAGSTQM